MGQKPGNIKANKNQMLPAFKTKLKSTCHDLSPVPLGNSVLPFRNTLPILCVEFVSLFVDMPACPSRQEAPGRQ